VSQTGAGLAWPRATALVQDPPMPAFAYRLMDVTVVTLIFSVLIGA
jgi:hypothetical protein